MKGIKVSLIPPAVWNRQDWAQRGDSERPLTGYMGPDGFAYATVQDIPGEKPFMLDGTRWQWVMLVRPDGTPIGPRYYHVHCDALVDDAGRCVLCRAASPALLLEKALL